MYEVPKHNSVNRFDFIFCCHVNENIRVVGFKILPLNLNAHQKLNILTEYWRFFWWLKIDAIHCVWYKFISIFTLKMDKWVKINRTFSAMVRYSKWIMTPFWCEFMHIIFGKKNIITNFVHIPKRHQTKTKNNSNQI